MKTISRKFRAGLGSVLMGAFLTAMAAAQCGSPTAKLAGSRPDGGTDSSCRHGRPNRGHVACDVHGRGQPCRTTGRHSNRQCPCRLACRWHRDHELGAAASGWGLLHGRLEKRRAEPIQRKSLRLGQQRYHQCAERDWESNRADPDHRKGYFVGGRKLFQRHVFAESHRYRREDDCLYHRRDHGDSRHHGNDGAGLALR
jgi:hypothetical protein